LCGFFIITIHGYTLNPLTTLTVPIAEIRRAAIHDYDGFDAALGAHGGVIRVVGSSVVVDWDLGGLKLRVLFR